MGRWSQRRMRSTAESLAPPPPPVNITLVEVIASDSARITFDADPGYNGSNADGFFLVNGTGFQTTSAPTSLTVELVQPFGQPPLTPGDLWDLSGQPAWADNVVVQPVNGVTV